MTDSKPPFEVRVDVADGVVTAVADETTATHTAVIRRSAGAEVVKHVPIGTRNAPDLSMTVDDQPVTLTPGPGGLTRGSYKVTAVHAGATYVLKPGSATASRLTRDGAQLGELSRSDATTVKAWWDEGATVTGTDAAIGYALAAAFGTGKKFFLVALLEDGSNSVPG